MNRTAFRTQKIFFALGTVCTLTVYGAGSLHALDRAKARVMEIDKKLADCHSLSARQLSRGYAAQEIRRILQQGGIGEALAVIGETVVNIGSERRVGLQNPFGTAGENFAYIDVKEKAVVSAGLYSRGFEQLSNAGNHGDDALAGLTLIGDDAVKLSTLCNIAAGLSVDDAMALLNDTDVEAIFVTRGEQVACTDGLSKRPSKRMAA